MIAVLFAHRQSVYKTFPDVDVWDIDRDARLWRGGCSVVAHPPCRAWGPLRQFSKPRPDEKALAPWAVQQVQKWGGVLEHPMGSMLWQHCGLPPEIIGPRLPGLGFDSFGGYTIRVDQFCWGHLALKASWLYIVGCPPSKLPLIPKAVGKPEYAVDTNKRPDAKPYKHLPKSQREHTPIKFAEWLVLVASRCAV
jgi:hypothetical protein